MIASKSDFTLKKDFEIKAKSSIIARRKSSPIQGKAMKKLNRLQIKQECQEINTTFQDLEINLNESGGKDFNLIKHKSKIQLMNQAKEAEFKPWDLDSPKKFIHVFANIRTKNRKNEQRMMINKITYKSKQDIKESLQADPCQDSDEGEYIETPDYEDYYCREMDLRPQTSESNTNGEESARGLKPRYQSKQKPNGLTKRIKKLEKSREENMNINYQEASDFYNKDAPMMSIEGLQSKKQFKNGLQQEQSLSCTQRGLIQRITDKRKPMQRLQLILAQFDSQKHENHHMQITQRLQSVLKVKQIKKDNTLSIIPMKQNENTSEVVTRKVTPRSLISSGEVLRSRIKHILQNQMHDQQASFGLEGRSMSQSISTRSLLNTRQARQKPDKEAQEESNNAIKSKLIETVQQICNNGGSQLQKDQKALQKVVFRFFKKGNIKEQKTSEDIVSLIQKNREKDVQDLNIRKTKENFLMTQRPQKTKAEIHKVLSSFSSKHRSQALIFKQPTESTLHAESTWKGLKIDSKEYSQINQTQRLLSENFPKLNRDKTPKIKRTLEQSQKLLAKKKFDEIIQEIIIKLELNPKQELAANAMSTMKLPKLLSQ